MRDMRISEMDDEAQEYLESYIPKYVPKHRPVYVWFDMYDLEEGRLKIFWEFKFSCACFSPNEILAVRPIVLLRFFPEAPWGRIFLSLRRALR